MATKIYKLDQKKNSATFSLSANNGKMQIEYTFKDGNQLTRTPARCTLRNEFYQSVLEGSALFQNGVIKLERTIKDETKAETKGSEYKDVDDITSPEQAIEYVFNTWGLVVKTAKQAKSFANKKGYDFPNLKEKNNDK